MQAHFDIHVRIGGMGLNVVVTIMQPERVMNLVGKGHRSRCPIAGIGPFTELHRELEYVRPRRIDEDDIHVVALRGYGN